MDTSHISLLPSLMNCVLEEIQHNYTTNKRFTDDDLLVLYCVFGNIAEKSLELVEKDTVKQICLQNSSRFVYQVTGSSNKSYYIFPENNFCQCPAYYQLVLTNRSQVTCKHVLACRLCIIMNRLERYEVNLAEFTDIQKIISQNHYY